MGSAGQALKRRQTEEDRKMKTAPCILLAACLFVATVSSHPHPLGKEAHLVLGVEAKTACSIDELLKCQEEINQAMSDCSHLDTLTEITTCINDILTGLPDCQRCVCDALPQLCGIWNISLSKIRQ